MKPVVHKRLTRVAIELCGDTLSQTMREHAKAIVRGSVYEDDVTLERLLNWHFYRSDDSPISRRRWGIVRPTSEHIFIKHIQALKRAPRDNEARYLLLGRLLHHIQDMSTPSHVLAIYHGPGNPDPFETFVEDHLCAISGEGIDPPTPPADFWALYQKAARETLAYVDGGSFEIVRENGRERLKFSEFWKTWEEKEDPMRRGFGTFGPLSECFDRFDDPSDTPCGISDATLLQIQKTLCDRAVVDSCRALRYADTLPDGQ